MDYKIVKKEEYMVLAKTRYFTSENSTEEIPKFWSEYFGDGSHETVCGMLGICEQEKVGSKEFRYDIELYADGNNQSEEYVSEIWLPVKRNNY